MSANDDLFTETAAAHGSSTPVLGYALPLESERRDEAGTSRGLVGAGGVFPMALPGFETEAVRGDDVVLTPLDVALDVVNYFKPRGRVLDPCRGSGAFANLMPGCDWCEIRDGRDFFAWREPVDWIVSNPPYSIFSEFLRHSFTVAENVVYLIPVNKLFNSMQMMVDVWVWGGVPTIYAVDSGGRLGFPIGFAIGAVHFKRGYRGDTKMIFRAGGGGVEQVREDADGRAREGYNDPLQRPDSEPAPSTRK